MRCSHAFLVLALVRALAGSASVAPSALQAPAIRCSKYGAFFEQQFGVRAGRVSKKDVPRVGLFEAPVAVRRVLALVFGEHHDPNTVRAQDNASIPSPLLGFAPLALATMVPALVPGHDNRSATSFMSTLALVPRGLVTHSEWRSGQRPAPRSRRWCPRSCSVTTTSSS